MRLWFSVTAMLILAVIILEASAAKSNKVTADSRKGNDESTNSNEVRYSKNKNSDYKKKENGKEEVVIKEREPRHKREGNQNTDSNKISKKNKNKRGEKVHYKGQKNRKPNEQGKLSKSQDNVKVNENKFKRPEDSVKDHKRSLEIEQPDGKSSIYDARGSEDFKTNSEPRKIKRKDQLNKKTSHGVEESADDEANRDTIVNNDRITDDKLSRKTASSVNSNIDSGSKKIRIAKDQQGTSKKIKRQAHGESEESNRENGSSKKRDSTGKKVQTLDRTTDVGPKNSEDSILASENSYYLNGDGVIKEKDCESMNVKQYKTSKKSSGIPSKCECQESGCKMFVSDTQRRRKQKLEIYEFEVCNLEAEHSIKEGETHNEKSENFSADTTKTGKWDCEEEEVGDKDSKNLDIESAENNEAQDETVESKNCVEEE